MRAWTWVRGTRPRAERSGAAMAGPTTTWTLTGRTNFDPLGMASAVPPIPMGTMGAPVRAAEEGGALVEVLDHGPRPSGALGEQDEHVAAFEDVLGPVEREAVGPVAVDREGAHRVEERAQQRRLPQLVLGHVEDLALGHLGDHEEVHEAAVHRGQDHRARGRDGVGAVDLDPPVDPVDEVDEQPEHPVDDRGTRTAARRRVVAASSSTSR